MALIGQWLMLARVMRGATSTPVREKRRRLIRGWILVRQNSCPHHGRVTRRMHSLRVILVLVVAAVPGSADALFTLSAVPLQPVSGGLLMLMSSTSITEGWLLASPMLYTVAGAFWAPVVFMQIEMLMLDSR